MSVLERIRFKSSTLAGPLDPVAETARLKTEFTAAKAGAVDAEKQRWRRALDRQGQAAAIARSALAEGGGRMAPDARDRLRAVIGEGRESVIARLKETRPEPPTWEHFLRDRGAAGDVAAVALHRAVSSIREATERVERTLATEPWQTADERRADRILDSLMEPRLLAERTAKEAAMTARTAVDKRRQAAGWLTRMWPSWRAETAEMEAAAVVAERAAEDASYRAGDRRGLEPRAEATAVQRHEERRAWLDRPETKEAMRAAEELKLVQAAVHAGDPEITRAAAAGDIKTARESAVSQITERQQHELEQRLAGYIAGAPRPGAAGGRK